MGTGATRPRAFVAASMGRVHAMRRAGRVGLPVGGYGRLFDRFATSIGDAGVKIDYGTPVVSVRPTGRGLEVDLDDGVATFDRVVVTTSAPLAADLCPEVSPVELQRLRSVRYVGVVTASLVLPRRLSPFFQTLVGDSTAPLGSIVETTPLGDRQGAVVHLSAYAPTEDRLFDEPDATLMASAARPPAGHPSSVRRGRGRGQPGRSGPPRGRRAHARLLPIDAADDDDDPRPTADRLGQPPERERQRERHARPPRGAALMGPGGAATTRGGATTIRERNVNGRRTAVGSRVGWCTGGRGDGAIG